MKIPEESPSEKKGLQDQTETGVSEKDIKTLEKELAEAKTEVKTNLTGWQRAQADLVNFRRRVEQEKEETVKFASSALILKLLPVLDDFERAENSVPSEYVGERWVSGILLIEKNLRQTLESQGLAPIKTLGEPFDPCLMEAVSCLPGKEGTVIMEIRKGYTLNGKLFRPASVVVGTGEDSKKESEEV